MSGEPAYPFEPVTRDLEAESTVARLIYENVRDCLVRAELLSILGIHP